jgi:hypothetical protein
MQFNNGSGRGDTFLVIAVIIVINIVVHNALDKKQQQGRSPHGVAILPKSIPNTL